MKTPVHVLCLLLGAVTSLALSATSQPASAPAETSALDRVHTALTLSQKDELLLSSLRDATAPVEQNGFYRMMQIVAALPPLSAGELRQLDSPAWANLLRDPGRYRAKTIRLPLRVYVVRKLTVKKGLRANPYWPDDKPIYEIHATCEGSDDEPVVLCSPSLPPNLGRPDETLPDGRERYKSKPAYEAAGVFLQYYTEASTDTAEVDGATRKYPVILAWQFVPRKSAVDSFFGPFTEQEELYAWGTALLVLVAVLGVFVFVQRRMRRPSALQRGPAFKDYKPLRDEEPEENIEDDEFVDPDLATAVEDFHKKHPPETNEEKP